MNPINNSSSINNGNLLQNNREPENVRNNLRNDRDLALASVRQNGWALQYATDNLRRDVVLAPVQPNNLALQIINANGISQKKPT